MKRSIVEEQVRLFILLAAIFTLLSIIFSLKNLKPLLVASLVLLTLSPFISYLVVIKVWLKASK